jgi:hypothetical protein
MSGGDHHASTIAAFLALAVVLVAAPAQADPSPRCRLNGDAMVSTGDRGSGSAHTTDFQSNLGTGHWRHVTFAGDRFDGRLSLVSCHDNTGHIADLEGKGSFQGSTVVLTFFAHFEDRTDLGQPDYYSIGLFSGTTLVYATAGQVVEGDLEVTITA